MTLFNYLSTAAFTVLGAAQLFAQTSLSLSGVPEPECARSAGEEVYCVKGGYFNNMCFANRAHAVGCVWVGDGSNLPRVAVPTNTNTDQAIALPSRPDYACLDVYRPVCANGVTYGNACYASRAGATSWTEGACGKTVETALTTTNSHTAEARRSDYACMDVYDPVCANGVTYGNACYASLAGETSWTKGACGSTAAEYRTANPTTTANAIQVDCLYDPTVRIYCSSTGLYYRDACAARKAGATGCYPVVIPDQPREAEPTNSTTTTNAIQVDCLYDPTVRIYCSSTGLYYRDMCAARKAGATGCVVVSNPVNPRESMPADGVARKFDNDYKITIFPNPAQNTVTIQMQDASAQSIRMYNIAGQLVHEQQNMNASQTEISVADLANGIYTVSIITEKGIRNERVQVQH